MSCRAGAVLTALLFLLPPPIRGADDSPSDDEQLLRRAGVGTDSAALLRFLEERTAHRTDPERLASLVRQLGHDRFEEREAAAGRLRRAADMALPALRHAVEDPDPELARRARECIHTIEQGQPGEVALAVVRTLVRKRPAGSAEALLAYLPVCGDDLLEEEITFGLYDLARRDEKVLAPLVRALGDPVPIRRRAAACIVGRLGSAEQRAAVRRLLDDNDPEVRLRAAQGLLAAGEQTGVPTLIDLLKGTTVTVAWQAEELLHYAAGETAPAPAVGGGSAFARLRCRQAWKVWWRQYGDVLDLREAEHSTRRPGLFLVFQCRRGIGPTVGLHHDTRLLLCGCDGEPRWTLRRLTSWLTEYALLPNGRLLCAESVRLGENRDPGSRLVETDLCGRVMREWRRGDEQLVAFRRLPGGHLLLTARDRVTELGGTGAEVFCYTYPSDKGYGPGTRRLGNGLLRCCRSTTVVEFDVARGEAVREMPLASSGHALLIPLRDGHFLLRSPTFSGPDLIELDEQGRTLWRRRPGHVPDAVRLRSGNLLQLQDGWHEDDPRGITRVPVQPGLHEIDPGGVTRWSARPPAPRWYNTDRVRPCLELVGLGFDSPHRPDVDSIECCVQALRSRKPVVRAVNADRLGARGATARSAIPVLTALLGEGDAAVRSSARDALILIGPAALPAVVRVRREGSAEAREAARFVLNGLAAHTRFVAPEYLEDAGDPGPDPPAVVQRLLDVCRSGSWEERLDAVRDLGACRSDDERIMPALLAALDDEHVSVRKRAVESLMERKPRAQTTVPVLLKRWRLRKNDRSLLDQMESTALLSAIKTLDPRTATPLLIEEMRYNARHDLDVGRCARDLGALRPITPEVVRAFRDTLNDPHFKDGRDAILQGVVLLGPAGLPLLREELRRAWKAKKSDNAICALTRYFGELGPAAREAVPDLIEVMTKRGQCLMVAHVIFALGRIGPDARPAVPHLLRYLASCNYYNSAEAATALVSIAPRDAAVVAALVRELNNDRQPATVRANIALALGDIGATNSSVLPALAGVLTNAAAPPEVRTVAALALSEFGAEAVPDLLDALRGPDEDQDGSLPALRRNLDRFRLPFRKVKESLRKYLSPWDAPLCSPRRACVLSLGFVGPGAKAAVPQLASLVRERRLPLATRWFAVLSLARIGPAAAPAAPALVGVLRDADQLDELHAEVLRALTAVGPAAVPPLVEALRDEEWSVRLRALEALASLGPTAQEAVPAVRAIAGGDDRLLRRAARTALEHITPAEPGR
jgi:HEAT repeat protein